MKRSITSLFLVLSLGTTACGDDGDGNGGGGNGNQSGSSSGGSGNTGGSSGTGAKPSTSGGMPPMTPPGSTPGVMPVISKDVPAFASSSSGNSPAERAQDLDPMTRWSSTAVPAWLSYDLSGVPEAERQQVLLAWYAGATLDFINPTPNANQPIPIDYALELNTAEGGGEPPADGWEQIESVTGSNRGAHQRLVELNGANWVRLNVTKSSSDRVEVDFDVHSAPDGATDSWLFMGDSITFMSTSYVFSDLPSRVNALAAERWPAVIPAAIGGTNTTTALDAIETTMEGFPGRFVVLAYGTNDHPAEYHMDQLVQRVIDAGKAPAVPHMPWAADAKRQEEAMEINAMIDALYEQHPEILRGPDLYAFFEDRTDLIPADDIHPNEEGQAELRQQWAEVMTR